MDTFESRGILIGKNVNTCTFSNIRGYCGYAAGTSMPKNNVIGFQLISSGSTVAFGGHMVTNVDMESMGIAFQFTDTNLITLTDCFGDSVSGSAFQCTGSCSYINFLGCFAGTCGVGFDIAGSSSNIFMDGIQTTLVGVIPSWASSPSTFYTSSSILNISVTNTASATVGTWQCDGTPHATSVAGSWVGGNYLYVQSGATLNFVDYDMIYSGSATAVAPASTSFFTANGMNALESPTFVGYQKGYILGFNVQCNYAPGAGETFNYVTRINFADYGSTATISGASSYGTTLSTYIPFLLNDNFSVKLTTSTAAASASHRIAIKLKYLPNQQS